MFKKRIAFQLTAGFVIIVLISMLTVGVFFMQMFRQYAFDSREKQMLDRAHSIAGMMAETGASGGAMRGMGGFMRFLNTLTDSDVWILDAQGKPWTLSGMGMGSGSAQIHSMSTEPLPKEAEEVFRQVQSGKDSVSESFSSLYHEATLTVGTAIIDGNHQVVGMVLLHAPVTGISETMERASVILIISLAAALLVASGLGFAYSMRFIKPLNQMNRVALAMAAGNYETRTQVARQDELGQLGNSLDLLAAELGKTMDLLYQEKGKLEDVIASISEGIISFDSGVKPVNVNKNLGAIMGTEGPYTLEGLVADFEELRLLEELKQVIDKKAARECRRSFKGKHLKFTLSPIIDNKGEVTGAVALVQDVSASEKLEQLRRDFVANVSHEFRTPLTVIKGSLEALADGTVYKSEDVSRYITRVLSETRALERLVGDLLDLSRLQSESVSIHLEKVHMPSLLADTVKGIQGLAEEKGIRIELDNGGDIPPIQGDYDRLRQLMVIFLDNAIKYSPSGTCIHVAVTLQDRLLITIQDQGAGIVPEALPHIWDRFYQSDRSRESTGTGLGLSIAKRLIDLHGGSVSVSSTLGEGTTFHIGLPL